MATKQGDLSLLNEPIAQELLGSATPARFAYVGLDGTATGRSNLVLLGRQRGRARHPAESAESASARCSLEGRADNRRQRVAVQGLADPRQRSGSDRGGRRSGVRAGGGAVLWCGAGSSVGRASARDVSSDGSNRGQAGMGSPFGLRATFPQRDRGRDVRSLSEDSAR